MNRDKAENEGARKVFFKKNSGFKVDIVNWDQTFFNSKLSRIKPHDKIKDAGDMYVKQLQWLWKNNKI